MSRANQNTDNGKRNGLVLHIHQKLAADKEMLRKDNRKFDGGKKV